MSLQAVILAAGEGVRLRPLTQNKPKALIPVANKPIIEHTILSLLEAGIRDIIVVVGYRKEQVMRHLSHLSVPGHDRTADRATWHSPCTPLCT